MNQKIVDIFNSAEYAFTMGLLNSKLENLKFNEDGYVEKQKVLEASDLLNEAFCLLNSYKHRIDNILEYL